MTFWNIFIACLTGLGAATLAIGVVGLAVYILVNLGALAYDVISDAFENRRRR